MSAIGAVLAKTLVVALSLTVAYIMGGGRAKADAAAHLAKLQQAQQAAIHQAQQRAAADGASAVAALQTQLAAAQTHTQTLQERLRHAPIVTARPSVRNVVAACNAPDAAAATRQPGAQAGAAAPAQSPPALAGGAGADDPGITLAAVSLWNSALAGSDMPAGACTADQPASEACAADAGVTFTALWQNHTTNAASCAQDRARFAALIALLCKNPEQNGCTHE